MFNKSISCFTHALSFRSRNASGSPRPRSMKKNHFIKNMRQYDTRGSRCVYSLLFVGFGVVNTSVKSPGCVHVCVCACRSVFSTLVMFSLSVLQNKHSASCHHYLLSLVRFDPLHLLYAVFLYDPSCEDIISDSLYTNTEDTEERKLCL